MLRALILGLVLLTATPALAEEMPLTKFQQSTKALMDKMDENQLKQFAAIRGSHGTIRAVESVQASVRKAVEACAKQNPDISARMNGRFDDWRGAVRPVLKKAQSKLDKMILLQSFGKPSEVRSYLGEFDAVIAARDAQVTAVPVTEKAECERLVVKMDGSQAELVKLLNESLALDQPIKQKDM